MSCVETFCQSIKELIRVACIYLCESVNNILLTIDVEDWFQVENFKACIPFSSWDSRELRVEKNTHRLLDLFDSCSSTQNPIKATFFILGWIAERLPDLVKEIHKRGHEIASHGYNHNLCYEQSVKDLKEDLCTCKKLLEDITGAPVIGYRAPSFSINQDVLKIIEDCGYLYDSSYNSFAVNKRYGRLELIGKEKTGIAIKISENFFELPISNLKLKTQNSKPNTQNLQLPWGGGGYFRLIPFFIFKPGIKSILNKDKAYMFYMHPWEIDPDQPRLNKASISYKFRHYYNLNHTYSKIKKILKNFNQDNFITCNGYLMDIKE